MKTEIPKLTQFSPGAGCGCKIAPKVLDEILKNCGDQNDDPNLLVGNNTKDDASVFDIGNGKAIINTTDVFTPIVDDPYTYGKIAAINAISDVYAMGGKPLTALSILGWPTDKLPVEYAGDVIKGARDACKEAGIKISGGHSISISDPIFGLAVTGIIDTDKIKTNSNATEDSHIYLTKPLGIGIITTAEKRGLVKEEHKQKAVELMCSLNKIGYELSGLKAVTAMTDVTGFGLLGHLFEVCEGSGLNAVIKYNKVPTIDGLDEYVKQNIAPGGTTRNFESYGHKIHKITEEQKLVLCDPQTSGGLLIAVKENGISDFESIMKKNNQEYFEIGYFIQKDNNNEKLIKVE